MLSILIPVFNQDCQLLVNNLHQQCLNLDIEFEILVYDDFSSNNLVKENNAKLSSIKSVVYHELTKNFGRAKIRNQMANDAKYNNLLFIDSDMAVIDELYISKFINSEAQFQVIYGGLIYASDMVDPNKSLRLKYGKERECLNVKQRNLKPFQSIKTCNLWIKKDTFQKNPFDETILNYGYEDTLFGIQLDQFNTSILHINNPLIHHGVETNDEFLHKTRVACKSLITLSLNKEKIRFLVKIKLFKAYQILDNWKLKGLFEFTYSLFEKWTERNLRSENPKMWKFDFYKLYYLVIFSKN